MNYSEAQTYLNSFVNFEKSAPNQAMRAALTLGRVRELAGRFQNPQDKFPVLHVAGTKGKGSTCAFAESILRAAGVKTGLYISPHLQDVRERIGVSGEFISEAEFARVLSGCVAGLEDMRHPPEGERRPTYFEVLTHLAFAWFAEKKVDVAIVEVGLGGRLDATNIVNPLACAITNISLEHQAVLGDTLELIAAEKAGIMKRGVPVVIAPQLPKVRAALQACADSAGARAEVAGVDFKFGEIEAARDNSEWPFPHAELTLADGTRFTAELGLHGRHQVDNWAVAVRLADLFWLRKKGAHIPAKAVAEGSRALCWPGRLEEVAGAPKGSRVFLDGAHNEHSIRTVIVELRRAFPAQAPAVLFACAKDKDSRGMLKALAESGVTRIVFSHSGNARGKEPVALAREWNELTGGEALMSESSKEGLEAVMRIAGANGLVLITGSLYLVGAVKDLVQILGGPLRRGG